jgi:hypothetical protein
MVLRKTHSEKLIKIKTGRRRVSSCKEVSYTSSTANVSLINDLVTFMMHQTCCEELIDAVVVDMFRKP